MGTPVKLEYKKYQVESQPDKFDMENHIRWGIAYGQGGKPEMEDVYITKNHTKKGIVYNYFAMYYLCL